MAIDDNPFQAPPNGDAPAPRLASGDAPAPAQPPMRPVAVLVGAGVDTVGTMAFQFLYVMVMVFRIGGSGFEREVERTLRSPPHALTLYVVGGAMSVLGGLVAGGIARRNELWHGLATGVASVLFAKALSGPSEGLPRTGLEAWMDALGTPLTIACAGIGGYLALKRRRASEAAG